MLHTSNPIIKHKAALPILQRNLAMYLELAKLWVSLETRFIAIKS